MYQVFAEEPLRIGERFKDCGICPDMMVVPPGEIIIRGAFPDKEKPGQTLRVSEMFAMSVYEITVADWENCQFLGVCRRAESIKRNEDKDFGWREWKGTRPIVNVNWEDAATYAIWLSSVTKENYWLPTELQWEYAARAGIIAENPWLGVNENSCDFANLSSHDGCSDRYRNTAPVGSYNANRFGLYDMIGNVSEWTASCSENVLGSTVNLQRPLARDGFKISDFRKEMRGCDAMVYRGGSRSSGVGALDFSTRGALPKGTISETLGFRVVRSIQ